MFNYMTAKYVLDVMFCNSVDVSGVNMQQLSIKGAPNQSS